MEKPVVLLLAGGRSTRFWPLSEKNTYKFLGKNLVEYHIETLKRLGFKELIVVASDKVFDFLVSESQRFSDFKINYVRQKEEISGMAGAVLSAKENFQSYYRDRSLYILNCNDIYEESLHEKVLAKMENEVEEDVLIAGYQVKKYKPLGYLKISGGRITEIIEKPGEENMPSNLAKMVVDLFKKPNDFFEELEKEVAKNKKADDVYEKALHNLIQRQEARVVIYEGRWEILKYPWQVLSVMNFYLKNLKNTLIDLTADISEKAIIEEEVVISERVKVMEGVKIVGPCFIGKDTVIGNNSLIVKSMIGENCLIGFDSEVTRSYLGDEVRLHRNYVGDSVLEGDVSLGGGTVASNLRLDEEEIKVEVKGEEIKTDLTKLGMIIGQGVRFGVNVSVMPGVKVGAGSFVGSGVVLDDDVEENVFCRIEQKIEKRENKKKIRKKEDF